MILPLLSVDMKTAPRAYRMTSRARAVEETRDRVLAAAIELHTQRLSSDISLADVAGAAQVSVQTLLRHFGTREGLVEAALQRVVREVEEERHAEAGDVRGAVRAV